MRGDLGTFRNLTKLADARVPKFFTGIITAQNEDDGSYQVIVNERQVGYPRVFRSGANRRQLHPRERVVIRQTGVVMEIE